MNVKGIPSRLSSLQGSYLNPCFNSQTRKMLVLLRLKTNTCCVQSHNLCLGLNWLVGVPTFGNLTHTV